MPCSALVPDFVATFRRAKAAGAIDSTTSRSICTSSKVASAASTAAPSHWARLRDTSFALGQTASPDDASLRLPGSSSIRRSTSSVKRAWKSGRGTS